MANPERGEARLTVGDRDYTLRLTINAQCELEEKFAAPVVEIMTKIAAGWRTHLRALLWACLLDRHGAEYPTIDAVGPLMDAAGGAAAVEPAILAAIQAAAPPKLAPAPRGEDGAARPRRRATAIDGATPPPIAPRVGLA